MQSRREVEERNNGDDGMRRRSFPWLVGILLAIVALQAGCAQPFQASVTITGTVLGDSLKASATGTGAPIAATVTCNGVSTVADKSGHYALSLAQAGTYSCQAVEKPSYASVAVRIAGHTRNHIELDFGATHAPACEFTATSPIIVCEQLHLQPGSLRGTVTYAHSGAPAAGMMVQCPDLANSPPTQVAMSWLHTTTDQTGAYTLPDVAAGTHICFATDAQNNMAPQAVIIKPGETAQANFSICASNCPPVRYHFGNVMHQYHAYLIYWTPSGSPLEPGGGATFKSLVQRYFSDVGGTPFYGILSQYWDYNGFVQNSATLAGTWTDTTPYKHCAIGSTTCSTIRATQSDPLLDTDIQAEVARAIKANPSWNTGINSEFFVFTGLGAEECITSDANADCSYKINRGFCGYHSSFHVNFGGGLSDEGVYAYIPNVANDGGLCTYRGFLSPNGDLAADSAIAIASHEQFESISDPLPDEAPGWYDDAALQSREGGEIADKCVRYFGTIRGDGSNVTLANGDHYLLQGEWSNKAGGCTLG
jgi:hypothetical protein